MTLMMELSADARAIDSAADRLGQRIKELSGAKDGQVGLKLRWEAALDEELLRLEDEMLAAAANPETKLPASLKSRSARMLEAEARVRLKKREPELWVEYAELSAEVSALDKWIKARERAASLRQSILSSQKAAG
jgi:hypothetical protein